MLKFIFFLVIFLVIFHLLTKKYINPYTFTIMFGKKGCGKSSTLQRLANQYTKKGWHVYCNIGDSTIPGVEQIDCSHLWTYFPDNAPHCFCPEHSVILIDELNLLWDNRDFKTFPKELQRWFRLQRHYKVKTIAFSQTFDCDKKLRDLADDLCICSRFFRIFTLIRPYTKPVIVIRPKKSNQAAQMVDDFRPKSIFAWSFTYIPRWVKKYNSFKV